ncbi:MAG: phage scaffolding protein [Bacillota bacterium]
MKTEFLKGLGLEQAVIDQIMAENGKDINAEKAKADAYKGQFDDVQAKLKAFDDVDVNDLKGQISKLQGDLTTKETDFKNQLADIEFARVLESAVAGTKPRNVKAVMALLDAGKLKESKNQQTDIAAALEAVKKDNDYLFEPAMRVNGSTPGPQNPPPEKGSTAAANNALRSLFGKGE